MLQNDDVNSKRDAVVDYKFTRLTSALQMAPLAISRPTITHTVAMTFIPPPPTYNQDWDQIIDAEEAKYLTGLQVRGSIDS